MRRPLSYQIRKLCILAFKIVRRSMMTQFNAVASLKEKDHIQRY